MNGGKKILFLSGLDFKRKSIQVILNTPLAFAGAGWDVHYVVARDTSRRGNYSYEEEFNPPGVTVHRVVYPSRFIYDAVSGLPRIILGKLRSYGTIVKLTWRGMQVMRRHRFDTVYGYECAGVLAVFLLRLTGFLRGKKVVSRFQGSFVFSLRKKWMKLLLGWDTFLPLYLPCDLLIMTDDGTQGDRALSLFGGKRKNIRFWVNGVDMPALPENAVPEFRDQNLTGRKLMLITVCRLESWKRVDRVLHVLHELVYGLHFTDFRHFILGEGAERAKLEKLAGELLLDDFVVFQGAVEFSRASLFMAAADAMICMYETSNAGNPLLEAIRTGKVIFTLDNGDTSAWIKHRQNGFIYPETPLSYRAMADDIAGIASDAELRKKIEANIRLTAGQKLWSWNTRLKKETEEVANLLK